MDQAYVCEKSVCVKPVGEESVGGKFVHEKLWVKSL